MASFTLDGQTYEYLRSARRVTRRRRRSRGSTGTTRRSWPLSRWPAAARSTSMPSPNAGTPSNVLVSWDDDADHNDWAWVPAGNVRRVTDSEWDIEEYRRCPEKLRAIRWGFRPPGFLPA